MYNIGTQREISSRIPISYVGIPENVQLEKKLPQKLKFIIKDEGKIIWSYPKSLFDTLKIDLTNHFNENNTLEIVVDLGKELLVQIGLFVALGVLHAIFGNQAKHHLGKAFIKFEQKVRKIAGRGFLKSGIL